jgi:hypothetical protein
LQPGDPYYLMSGDTEPSSDPGATRDPGVAPLSIYVSRSSLDLPLTGSLDSGQWQLESMSGSSVVPTELLHVAASDAVHDQALSSPGVVPGSSLLNTVPALPSSPVPSGALSTPDPAGLHGMHGEHAGRNSVVPTALLLPALVLCLYLVLYSFMILLQCLYSAHAPGYKIILSRLNTYFLT